MKFSFFIFILYFICFLKGEIINNPVKTNKESNPINYIILYKSPTATIQTTQTQILTISNSFIKFIHNSYIISQHDFLTAESMDIGIGILRH